MTGRIFSIQRMSTEDGPGIRTTVFMKGCSLHCTWCHNPERISSVFQVQWIGSRCIGCKTCVEICPKNALALSESGMAIDRELCDGCGKCCLKDSMQFGSTPMQSTKKFNSVVD